MYILSLVLFILSFNCSFGQTTCFKGGSYRLRITKDTLFQFYRYKNWGDEVTITRYSGLVTKSDTSIFLDTKKRLDNLTMEEVILPDGFFDYQFTILKKLFRRTEIQMDDVEITLKSCNCSRIEYDHLEELLKIPLLPNSRLGVPGDEPDK